MKTYPNKHGLAHNCSLINMDLPIEPTSSAKCQ